MEPTAKKYYLAGRLLYESNLFKEAISFFSKALKKGIKNANIYLYTGLCYHQLNQPDKANEFFNKALSQEPNNIELYISMTKAYIEKNNKEKAQKYLNKSISILNNIKQKNADEDTDEYFQIINNL